jgi:hypothetical protein
MGPDGLYRDALYVSSDSGGRVCQRALDAAVVGYLLKDAPA